MRFGGIVLAVLLTLGACSSDPEPKEPKRTATSATPTATPPTMPAQAKQDTPEGAAAFVKHYIDVFNYAASTGDVEELSRLSSPDCEGCQSYIKLYRDTYKAGGYFRDKAWSLSKLQPSSEGNSWLVLATAKAGAGTIRTSRGSAERDGEAFESSIGFRVTRADSFRVTELGLGGAQS